MLISPFVYAEINELKPPNPINTLTIAARVLEKTLSNTHYQIIGACFWAKKIPPRVEPSPAIDQFLPDLIVTVSNLPGENPWVEMNLLYENELMLQSYQSAFSSLMGSKLDFGDASNQITPSHLNEMRTRIVSVIGSPSNLYRLPKITHKPETWFGKLYYSSLVDAYQDRSEQAEIAYMATHPHLLIGHDIGTLTNHWGQEIPRAMHITQPSRFRASVVAAMHAADIVTNQQSLHLSFSTKNSCGSNCVAANVVYDPKQDKVLWQEVYPNNRMIEPGNPNDFGEADDRDGHGNYIFVIWRKYRGCVAQEGHLIHGTPNVGKPIKR